MWGLLHETPLSWSPKPFSGSSFKTTRLNWFLSELQNSRGERHLRCHFLRVSQTWLKLRTTSGLYLRWPDFKMSVFLNPNAQVGGLGIPTLDRHFSANPVIVYEPVFKNHWPRWNLLSYPSGNRGYYLATQTRSKTLNTYSRNSLCLSKTDDIPPLECLNWRPLLWGSWGPLLRVAEGGKSSGKKQKSDLRGTVFKSSSLMWNGRLGQETESSITKKEGSGNIATSVGRYCSVITLDGW